MVVRMENVNNRKSLNRIFDNTEILWACIEFSFIKNGALFKWKACKGFIQTNPLYHLAGEIFSLFFTGEIIGAVSYEGKKSSLEEDV